jgi:hypothetical protein
MKKIMLNILFAGIASFSFAQSDYGTDQSNAIQQMGEDEISNMQQQEASNDAVNSSIGDALGHLNTFLSIASSAQDLYNASRSLSSGECAPDFSTDSRAMMPSSCTSADCQECYTKAVNELNFVRRQLGRLSCIYNNTKNFNNSAIAFGDNASGIHAVTGLAWQNARAEIVAEYNHFKQTYDDKYQGMMGSLEKALKSIGDCERQFGGDSDWYQRFGFIYLEFMKDKYKRND